MVDFRFRFVPPNGSIRHLTGSDVHLDCVMNVRFDFMVNCDYLFILFIYFYLSQARFNDTRLVVFDGSDEVTDQREENGDAGDDPVASCVDALPADDAREVLRQQFPSAETQQTVAGVG